MPSEKWVLRERLSRSQEIELTVIGRSSGRPSSRPVWFVVEGDTLYLLPVQGSDTQWYKNVLKNRTIRIGAHGLQVELEATPIAERQRVASVVQKFRDKYGAGEVKKYYSGFDVAVSTHLR